MRLIDADRNWSEEASDNTGYRLEYENGTFVVYDDDMSVLCGFTPNLPTAYDVDKVAGQLESESERWHESGKEYQDNTELGVAAGFRHAIKIVKAGGVNE